MFVIHNYVCTVHHWIKHTTMCCKHFILYVFVFNKNPRRENIKSELKRILKTIFSLI